MVPLPFLPGKRCFRCSRHKPLAAFHRQGSSSDGRTSWCKECKTEYDRAWREANPDKVKSRWHNWFKKNKDKKAALTKEWVKKNPHRVAVRASRRNLQLQRATPPWYDEEKVAEIYRRRDESTELFGEKFHVDHIFPIQAKDVCGLHVHTNMRVIPARENQKKSNKWRADE